MANAVKRLAVLGSTGSIGRQTLEVVRALPDRFSLVGLAAGNDTALLEKQISEFRPRFIYYRAGKAHPISGDCQFLPPEEMASHPQVDTVVVATPGRSGLSPTLAAVKAGKNVALANKESLVTAGRIIMREAELSGAHIMPVDSEHSAIWQCLEGENKSAARLILTASGGPFLNYLPAQLAEVTAEQALKHPSWRMGKKVTLDSATLMNKGLEVIEAHWLFGMPFNDISVLIHRQSIVHSIVEFIDGSAKAQLSCPDMRLPIQYALTYPQRLANPELPRLDWSLIRHLDFEEPDLDAFPCLGLAIEAGKKGGTYPAVLSAADEVAVELFLSHSIRFTGIARLIEQVLSQHQSVAEPSLEEITAADAWARDKASQLAQGDKY
ncbi:MAG: 1-deoxy-D-xylulose-5-phosphate reductoisomerase [Dehalococcoidales bacterium]